MPTEDWWVVNRVNVPGVICFIAGVETTSLNPDWQK
jgi:hypothetical protein